MKISILFLDDDPNRHRVYSGILKPEGHHIDWAQTVEEAITFLQKNTYDLISLDHDLGGEVMVKSGDGTGYEVAQWISNNYDSITKYNEPQIHIHTLNPIGAKNMLAVLPSARIIPFTRLITTLIGP